MMGKRKRVVLTIQQKLELLKRLDNGEKAASLSDEYGISSTTIRDIKHNRYAMYEYITKVDSDGPLHRKSMKKSKFEIIDVALLDWFNQKKAAGEAITTQMCYEKAEDFHRAYNLGGSFRASHGWLARFKQRYGICEVGEASEETTGQRRQPQQRLTDPLIESTHKNKSYKNKVLDFQRCDIDSIRIDMNSSSEEFNLNTMLSDDGAINSTVEISPDSILNDSASRKMTIKDEEVLRDSSSESSSHGLEIIDDEILKYSENQIQSYCTEDFVSNAKALNSASVVLNFAKQRGFSNKDIKFLENVHRKIKKIGLILK